MATTTLEPHIGSVFDGRYVVRRVIAEGELGAIYAAEHRFMERSVAIHLASSDAKSSERLEHEARLLDRARGSRVLELLDVGDIGEARRFIITEPVLGRSLDGVLAVRGALNHREVLALGLDIAHALEAAHRVGVVHHGLCPASILCLDTPASPAVARLLDFGVWPSPLGMFGGSLGAMAYAAPERFLNEKPDPACDIHALGAILYEAACGKLPPRAQRTESALAASVDTDLARVIARALGDLEHRYDAMSEVIEALELAAAINGVVTQKVVSIGSVPPPRRSSPNQPTVPVHSSDGLDTPMRFASLPSVALSDDLDDHYLEEDDEPSGEHDTPGHPLEVSDRAFDNRRAFPRVGFVTPVRVRTANAKTLDGRSHAIGEGGMLVLIQQPLPDGELVALRFSLPTTGRVVTVKAEIRYVSDNSGRCAVGVKFLEPKEEVVVDIREYVRLMGGR